MIEENHDIHKVGLYDIYTYMYLNKSLFRVLFLSAIYLLCAEIRLAEVQKYITASIPIS